MPPTQQRPGGGSGYILDPTTKQPIHPALETGGNLAGIKAKTDNLDILLSLLARAAAQTDGTQKAQLADGSGNVATTSAVNSRRAVDVHVADTSVGVNGITAAGSAPTVNPVDVSGVDGGGIKRRFLTDTTGRTLTTDLATGAGGATAPTSAHLIAGIAGDTGNLQSPSMDLILGDWHLYTVDTPRVLHDVIETSCFGFTREYTTPNNTNENAALLIRNGSAKALFIQTIGLDCGSAVAGDGLQLRAYYAPTITSNGTAGTAVNMQAGNAAAANAGLYPTPTISAFGTRYPLTMFAYGRAAADRHDYNFGIMIPANTNFLFTVQGTSNSLAAVLELRYMER